MIHIHHSGIATTNGEIDYLWFEVQEDTGRVYYRAVALAELAALPVTLREDYKLLHKQWAAVRGLYNAEADYVYTAAGIFTPRHVGIVQFYGGAGEAENLEIAADQARQSLAAVRATLANFAQSRLASPNPDWVAWYIEFITRRSQNILALLGHPDPRESRGGLGRDGVAFGGENDDLAIEQNELLFRGLARLRQDFVFQVTSQRRSREWLSEGLEYVGRICANLASRQRGSIGIGFNLSIPMAMAVSSAVSGGRSAAASSAQSQSDGVSYGWGQAHTNSTSHTESQTSTVGGSETHTTGSSITHSLGQTVSSSHTVSQAHSQSQGVSQSQGASTGQTDTQGSSATWSQGESANWSQGTSASQSEGASTSWSQGSAESSSQSASQNTSDTLGGSVSAGISGVAQASVNASHSQGASTSTGESFSQSSSNGGGASSTSSSGSSQSTGGGTSSSAGGSDFASSSSVASQSSSTAFSSGATDTSGSSDSQGFAESRQVSVSQSESLSRSSSWASSRGSADTTGQADSASQSWGLQHAAAQSLGRTSGQSAGSSYSGGMSAGLVPGIAINRSWQVEDDVLIQLTAIARQYESLLALACAEGAFLTSAVIFTADPTGAKAARALVPQAFHGPNVPMPVFTLEPEVQEEQDFRDHALAFIPFTGEQAHDLLAGFTGSGCTTLLLPQQNAAYTAPGLFEEGTASTVMAPIPHGIAFYPLMPGEVLLGHQYSPETADLTTAPVRLDQERMMHTLFAGDTGWGKSVAAVMLANESTLCWKTRTIVLDFGAGWRQLLNAPGLEGHVDILQLRPDAVRPLRWNPLQIGRRINPETQWRAFVDIFGSIARLGVRRQKQELLQALREVYLRAGVLVDDPLVRADPEWSRVCSESEAELTGSPMGLDLSELSPAQRQSLAVERSRKVGLGELYREVQEKLEKVPGKDTVLSGVLEGILFRLNPLIQGAAARQFAAGASAVPLEDLSRPWGVTVLEGGTFLDDFGKAFLLGWAGWHLYTDMVARRVYEAGSAEPLLQIYFEEANKIFSTASDASDDESGGVSTSQRFGDMFRDARKYNCRLHLVTQAPSMIPQDIISSCNNLIVGFLKNPKDKDLILSALARSERGFHDEEWRRFLTNENIGMAIGRFPYTLNREQQQPLLFKPLMLSVPEPTDLEIEMRLGRMSL